jgi:hypothetical protein
MTFFSPFMAAASLRWRAQAAQFNGYRSIVVATHDGNEKREAAAAVRALSQGPVNLSGRDDRVRVGRTHPGDRAPDIIGRNDGAGADDH